MCRLVIRFEELVFNNQYSLVHDDGVSFMKFNPLHYSICKSQALSLHLALISLAYYFAAPNIQTMA